MEEMHAGAGLRARPKTSAGSQPGEILLYSNSAYQVQKDGSLRRLDFDEEQRVRERHRKEEEAAARVTGG